MSNKFYDYLAYVGGASAIWKESDHKTFRNRPKRNYHYHPYLTDAENSSGNLLWEINSKSDDAYVIK